MKRIFCIGVLLLSLLAPYAQTPDTLQTRTVNPVKINRGQQVVRSNHAVSTNSARPVIYGEYKISGYDVLSTRTPSLEELNALVGSLVIVDTATITGSQIDPLTFSIYQVERQERGDYIYRVFGREIKAPEPDLPESFNVHKTDNERCYGIVEIGDGRIAIPYKGVLLYLSRS